MWHDIILLLLIALLAGISIVNYKKSCGYAREKEALQTVYKDKQTELENNYKLLSQKVYYEQKEKLLREEGDALRAQAQTSYQEYQESLVQAAKDKAAAEIRTIEANTAELKQKLKAEMETAMAQQCALLAEVDELRRQKDAAVEILKREEAVRREREFHSVQLTKDDLSDIIIIENLSSQISKRAPLRKLIWSEYYSRPFGEMADRILGKTKRCGIYKITEIETGKVYIGQSTDIRTRWSNHLKTIVGTDGGAAHTRFHDYVAKAGISNFTFELVEECPKDQLNEREKFYIELYRANDWGFNSTSGNK